MRGSPAAGVAAVLSTGAFQWDGALLATLHHVSLPWGEPLQLTTIDEAAALGRRDRLSLVAQFAAHQALLRFAGISDSDVASAEWAFARKRGADVRLVRVGARRSDPASSPSALAQVREFAEIVSVELPILDQSWARADAIYADAFLQLAADAAADLRWVRRAGTGFLASPGPHVLRDLCRMRGRFALPDAHCVVSILKFTAGQSDIRVAQLTGSSPLERYAPFGAFAPDPLEPSASVAERITAAIAGRPNVFIVTAIEAFDQASREVVEIVSRSGDSLWLIAGDGEPLPRSRGFIIAPRLQAAADLVQTHDQHKLECFVDGDGFAAYLRDGDLPVVSPRAPRIPEPAHSYLAALSFLGCRMPRQTACAILEDFHSNTPLEALVLDGITALEADEFQFVDESIRLELERSIAGDARSVVARVVAPRSEGPRAALLWLEAGDQGRAREALAHLEFESAAAAVAELRHLPRTLLQGEIAIRLAHALIDCGRYRAAVDVVPNDPFVLARAARRRGEYAKALAGLPECPDSFEAALLRAELLRLVGDDAAVPLLKSLTPATPEQAVRLSYEKALHGAPCELLPTDHYLEARLRTYRALDAEAFGEAASAAAEALERARDVTERIDASLDRLFALFSAGDWDAARRFAVVVLELVEETDGDRAAGGILFILAYLAADEAQWSHAEQRIATLRRFYDSTGDAIRSAELKLLTAHLAFSRGRFAEAKSDAESLLNERASFDQIREAAALIVDELAWMEGRGAPLVSTGKSGNVELARRRAEIVARIAGVSTPLIADRAECTPSELRRFRIAIHDGDAARARSIAANLQLDYEDVAVPLQAELSVLRAASVREFPFAPRDFDQPWCFGTRNRLGRWNLIGSVTPSEEELERADAAAGWMRCSERELLFIAGAARWSEKGREAVAALFRSRAEAWRLRRLLDQDESGGSTRAAEVEGIVGGCPAIRELEEMIGRVAGRDVPICILGESGTGKELVARAIHRNSSRRQKSFTAVNCAALPETLIESELFGHVRGAFTGADRDRAGLIETTDGGTLFLDEIGELPLVAQAKLLRFLQEGEFRRVGDASSRKADVRIVSATNRKLHTQVEEGRFRDDLYYRIRGVELQLPPLRERGGDVLLLASHFLAAEREKHRTGPTTLDPDVEAVFSAYPWPGNVRELQQTIRAAHALAGDTRQIRMEHLPERLRNVAPARSVAGSYQEAVARFKRDLIERSLAEARGNQNRAAALLKMSRQALAYQIRELGIMVRV